MSRGLFLFLSFPQPTLEQIQRFKSQLNFKTEKYSCMLAELGFPSPRDQTRQGWRSGGGVEWSWRRQGVTVLGFQVEDLGAACQNSVLNQFLCGPWCSPPPPPGPPTQLHPSCPPQREPLLRSPRPPKQHHSQGFPSPAPAVATGTSCKFTIEGMSPSCA